MCNMSGIMPQNMRLEGKRGVMTQGFTPRLQYKVLIVLVLFVFDKYFQYKIDIFLFSWKRELAIWVFCYSLPGAVQVCVVCVACNLAPQEQIGPISRSGWVAKVRQAAEASWGYKKINRPGVDGQVISINVV